MNLINLNIDVDKIIAEAKGSYSKYKENRTYSKENYDELLGKYSKAIEVIELLNKELEKLNDNEITAEKVEAMGSALELLGGLDEGKLEKIMKLGEKFGDKK